MTSVSIIFIIYHYFWNECSVILLEEPVYTKQTQTYKNKSDSKKKKNGNGF